MRRQVEFLVLKKRYLPNFSVHFPHVCVHGHAHSATEYTSLILLDFSVLPENRQCFCLHWIAWLEPNDDVDRRYVRGTYSKRQRVLPGHLTGKWHDPMAHLSKMIWNFSANATISFRISFPGHTTLDFVHVRSMQSNRTAIALFWMTQQIDMDSNDCWMNSRSVHQCRRSTCAWCINDTNIRVATNPKCLSISDYWFLLWARIRVMIYNWKLNLSNRNTLCWIDWQRIH